MKTKCELIQIPVDLTEYLIIPDDPLQTMGKSSIATILVAKHTKTPLFADDARLRLYAQKEFLVSGFWTQTFIIDCYAKNLITRPKYLDACIKLLKANYHFVSTNTETIIEVIRDSAYTQNDKVLAVLSSLRGPDAIEDTVINIGSQVLKDIWLSAVPLEQRILLTDLVLRNLCRGRKKVAVIKKLLTILDKILTLAPAHQQVVNRQVQLWYRMNSK
jgi:hypothetical protein